MTRNHFVPRSWSEYLLALRRFLPGPVQQMFKPLYRRWRQRKIRRQLAQALSEWQDSQQEIWRTRARSSTSASSQARRVLIVIVSYDNLDCIQLCLESIWGNTDYPNFQVVVVDNASGPAVVGYLQQAQLQHPGLKLILNSTNRGFAHANNIGLEAADYDYAILLNNDTIVTPGWLSRLIYHLERDPTLGMIGPTTNWANNQARIVTRYNSLRELELFAGQCLRLPNNPVEEVETLAMFCVALRRSVAQVVGPLDETYGLGLFEDDDYAMRIRQAGYRLAVARDVFIHHWGWASFGNMSQADYDKLFAANRVHFESKWGQWRRPPLQL